MFNIRQYFNQNENGFKPDWTVEDKEFPGSQSGTPPIGLPDLTDTWQWDELAAQIGQESQARVTIAGLPQAGKSLLFNRLRGWSVSWSPAEKTARVGVEDFHLEVFGSFILADMPLKGLAVLGEELLFTLGNPALIVYLLNGTKGVLSADYRWIAALRASGRPMVVALNKCDLIEDPDAAVAEAERRLGMPVIAISAETGAAVEERLLPALLDVAPRIAVPLGREILCLRRVAARRLTRQAALFSALIGGQPIPLVDLPVQAALQIGLIMRIGAIFGRPPTGGINREIIGTVAGSVGLRYVSLTLMKVVPLFGWVVAAFSSAILTALLGEAALRYYEAGGKVPLANIFRELSQGLRQQVSERRGR